MLRGILTVVYLMLLAALVLLVIRVRSMLHGVTRRATGSVWCPLRDRKLTAEVEETVWDGRRLDVIQCAAFSPPTAITCEKACLRLATRPGPPAGISVPVEFFGLRQ